MEIAKNLKCKDFAFVSRRTGSQLRGRENQWVCDIYYNGRCVATAENKTAAKRWVSKRVRAVNTILEAARKKYN